MNLDLGLVCEQLSLLRFFLFIYFFNFTLWLLCCAVLCSHNARLKPIWLYFSSNFLLIIMTSASHGMAGPIDPHPRGQGLMQN